MSEMRLSEYSPEAMVYAATCFEAINGTPKDGWPDPDVRFDWQKNLRHGHRCGARMSDRLVACANKDTIWVASDKFVEYEFAEQDYILAHEYLHVLYYRYVDTLPAYHHLHWINTFDRPECYGIPYYHLTDIYGEEQ